MFRPFDRLEEERLALSANFAIGGERRFDIGQQPPGHGDQVSLRGQLHELVQIGRVHGQRARAARRLRKRAIKV